MQDAYVYIHLLVYKSGRLMEASQISFQFVHEQRYVSRYMTGLHDWFERNISIFARV